MPGFKKVTVIIEDDDKTDTYTFDKVILDPWDVQFQETAYEKFLYGTICKHPKVKSIGLRFQPLGENEDGTGTYGRIVRKNKEN